jgi:choline dehydrogenase-like flavoprotein
VPFEDRPDTAAKKAFYPIPANRPLLVMNGKDIPATVEDLEADIVIVGSGAGGAIMAHSLLRRNSSLKIIMVERGDHTDASEMSSDEVDMLSRLYADGALQLSRDYNFQVLQGSCVGGSTVINNAVSFDLPTDVLGKWNDPQLFDAGIDEAKLAQSFQYVRKILDIGNQDESSHKFPYLNKGSVPFVKGIAELDLAGAPNEFQVVQANIKECFGCGYCNIGCKYGKKLSMLNTVLPGIQETYGRDALRIFAGCEVDKLHAKGKDITYLDAEFKDGRRVRIHGKKFVLSAGAISSSLILLKSNAGNPRVGKDLCFNLGSPITAVFDKVINAYEGLQISHYLLQKPSRGYVMETWFNPPVSQALTMPGWFDDHFNNMLRYNRLSSVGILVPTESNAEIRDGGLFKRDIKYKPTKNDLTRLGEGLVLGAKIFFAGGAKTVMPHTMDFLELKEEQLDIIHQKVLEPGGITLGTGHPQGGNKMSRDSNKGVISPEFKVYGYNNLFVADASVFPSSIGVNPQLTVMGLADYASEFIA